MVLNHLFSLTVTKSYDFTVNPSLFGDKIHIKQLQCVVGAFGFQSFSGHLSMLVIWGFFKQLYVKNLPLEFPASSRT